MNPLEPYLLYLKLTAAVLLAVGIFFAGVHWEKAAWDAEKVQVQKTQAKAVSEAIAHNAELAAKQQVANQKVEEDHAQAISKLNHDLADARRRINAAGGLRIPSSVCSGIAALSEATSPGVDHASSGIALPSQITDDLLDFARDAEATSQQVIDLQEWIKANGFFAAPEN